METTKVRDERFLSAHRFAAKQRLYFSAWVCAPAIACVIWFAVYPAITRPDIVLFLSMLSFTYGLGMSVGYHRYFTHAAFEAHPVLQAIMAAAGGMAAQGPPSYWVALHRCHHQFAEDTRDPHSPQPLSGSSSWIGRVQAFTHGHFGWVLSHDVPNPRWFAKDLAENSIVRFFDRTHQWWMLFGVTSPGLLMLFVEPTLHGFFRGCIMGGAARLVMNSQLAWAVNSIGHTIGRQEFKTRDSSTNSLPLALITYGEGWHNNHHAFPWSARAGLRWWEVDFGWWIICALSWLRLANHAKQPTAKQIVARSESHVST